jgi:aspartate racemase
VAPAIEVAVTIPLLHIVDATGVALQAAGIGRAGLLGTRYTMEQPFWRERLEQRCGIELVVPAADERVLVHRVIFEELCRGIVTDASRAAYVEIIEDLAAQGAEAVILGCTEIGLLVNAADSPLPVFDTTAIHVEAAVEFILGQQVC